MTSFKTTGELVIQVDGPNLKLQSEQSGELVIGIAIPQGAGEANTLQDAGQGVHESLVADPSKVGVALQVKGLRAGANVTLTDDPTDDVLIVSATGGGPGGSDLVGVSVDDTTPSFLENKLAAGAQVTLTTLNPGGNEQLQVDIDADPAGAAVTAVADHVAEPDPHPQYLLESNAPDPSAVAPPDVAGAGSAGVGTDYARSDHTHGHGNQAGGTLHAEATTSVAGFISAADKTKLDALVQVDLSNSVPSSVDASAGSAGVSADASRSDHAHEVAVGTPVDVGTANIEGVASTLARSDHVHDHADQPGGSLHAEATTGVAGFLSAADKTKLDGLVQVDLSNATPSAVDASAGSSGISADASRSDHAHSVAVGVPVDVGTANAEGVADTLARSDHVHDHGSLAGGSLHAAATSGAAGFLSAADKTKLDGIAASVVNPLDVSSASPSVGVATEYAREDHVHAHGALAGGALHADATTSVSGFLSGADKTKLDGIAAGATNTPLGSSTPSVVDASAGSAGVSTDAARADHAHEVDVAAPVTIGTANAEGVAVELARADHVHDHGNQTSPTLHAVATTGANGFMSSTDKTKLDGIATGATNTPLSSATPAVNTAAVGTAGVSASASRSDHRHQISTATPVAVGTANSEGTATTIARSDHVHDHGNQTVPTLHAVATGANNGFMSSADKSKLDTITAGAAAPQQVADSTPVVGSSTAYSREDHVHAHGDRGGGTLHAVATDSVAGFQSAADKARQNFLTDLQIVSMTRSFS